MSKAEKALKNHADNGPLVYSHNQVIKAMREMIEADREDGSKSLWNNTMLSQADIDEYFLSRPIELT